MDGHNEWSEDVKQALTFYRIILKCFGLWPFDAYKKLAMLNWTVMLLTQVNALVVIMFVCYVGCENTNDTMDNVLFATASFTSIVKYLVFRFEWKRRIELTDIIVNDWNRMNDNLTYKKIMMKWRKRGKYIALSMIGFMIGSCVFAILPTIVSVKNIYMLEDKPTNTTVLQRLPFGTNCAFIKYSSSFQIFMTVLQISQILVMGLSNITNDVFFYGITFHVDGQFEILEKDFLKVRNTGVKIKDFEQQSIMIKRHQRLIEISQILERAYNMATLSQVMSAGLQICIEGFQIMLSLKLNRNLFAVRYTIYFCTSLSQVFMYTYVGETLESHSEKLLYAIYQCDWYDSHTKLHRNIIFMIHSANKLRCLSAGKFMVINLKNFTNVLRAAASYLSMLRIILKV